MCMTLEKLEQENNILQKENKRLKEQMSYLKRMLFGRKKETIIDDGTPYLPNFEMPERESEKEEPEEEEETKVVKKRKKRKPFTHFEFPKDVPREEIIHDLTEDEKVGLEYIGNDVVEKLAYRPGSYFIKVHITKKYANPKDSSQGVISSDKLLPAISGSRVDESLLAYLLICKYCDHLPLYRLEGIFARDGLNITRQTLSCWALKAGELLQPLVDLFFEHIISQKVIYTDDTTIPIQVKGAGKTKTGRIWVYVSGGGADPPLVYYQFTQDRKQIHPMEKFENFKGAFHSDALEVYEKFAKRADITWQPCWAHARRKFFDSETSDPLKLNVLTKINELFKKEQKAWDIDKIEGYTDVDKSEERLIFRNENCKPIVDDIFLEIRNAFKTGKYMPKDSMTLAIAYLLKRENHFKSFLNNSELRIDNNVSERNIKPLTLGRKNWMFVGSDSGGNTTATILSFVQTCKNLNINPRTYIEDVLKRINNTPIEQLSELLPHNWKKD